MTLFEENIVNISMVAANLLKAGRIAYDDATGHLGMTQTIIALARQFEDQNSGVDYNAEGTDRDYWAEIDQFAEDKLLWMFGADEPSFEIKVIIRDGCLEDVRKNKDVPVHVEVINIDPAYEDYDELNEYADDIYHDNAYMACDSSSAHFYEEDPEGGEDD